jgi:hypothetical protein
MEISVTFPQTKLLPQLKKSEMAQAYTGSVDDCE